MRDAQAGRYHHVRHFVVLTTGEYTEIEFYTSCSHILSCLLLVIEKQRQRKHWTVFRFLLFTLIEELRTRLCLFKEAIHRTWKLKA